MPNTKISALTTETTLADNDLMVIVDVSDTTMAPSGTNKKTTVSGLATSILPYFDVRWFGNVGTADDSAVFTLAAQAARDAGGGIVQFPAGIYNCLNVPIYTGVHYIGCGKEATTLKLVAASNGQVFLTDGWVGLTGTDTDDGPTDWSVRNMTIDANGTGNGTASWGMLIYGSRFDMENVDFYGHRTGAISSEWATTGGPDRMEAHLVNVNCHTSFASRGIVWDGPHDSHWRSVSVISTHATGGADGMWFGSKALGTRLSQCHVWGSHQWAAIVEGDAIWFTQCFLEGGQVGQLKVLADQLQYRGGWILGNSVAGVKGIELGVAAGADATGCDIDTAVLLCRGGALGLVNQVSNKVRLHVFRDTTDPVVYGTATNTDWSDVDIQVEGTAGSDEYMQIRRRAIFHNRSTAASPVVTTKGHSSQTGPMQSWQTHAGVEVASVEVDGSMVAPNLRQIWVPASNFIAVVGTALGAVNGVIYAWMMDQTAVEYVTANIRFPSWWTSVQMDIHWSQEAAGTGNVLWFFNNQHGADGALLDAGAATWAFTATAVPTQRFLKVTSATAAITVTPSHTYTIWGGRNGADGSDTLPNDAALLGVMLREVSA